VQNLEDETSQQPRSLHKLEPIAGEQAEEQSEKKAYDDVESAEQKVTEIFNELEELVKEVEGDAEPDSVERMIEASGEFSNIQEDLFAAEQGAELGVDSPIDLELQEGRLDSDDQDQTELKIEPSPVETELAGLAEPLAATELADFHALERELLGVEAELVEPIDEAKVDSY